ncbi:HAD family hydrolase [Streptomyces sp. MMG1533]|uniref:HAD family hydrolase n=1 Tax=Streptomyces sp. MMG1533 TaxID=1415546 RepID=UPI00131CE5B2|nr:HAD hydrolase-like protein [Streptomyces sp. MMG1533]
MPDQPGQDSIYVQAARWRQGRDLELDLAGKMRILDHLSGYNPKIDFSGGDPMVLPENVQVMSEAGSRFGRDNVTLTATGAGLITWKPDQIAPLIGELNFTFDSPGYGNPEFRPRHYASRNLLHAARFARAGVKVRAECPLTTVNCSPERLEQIYRELFEHGIDTLLLMRLFPVGRGTFRRDMVPTRAQYLDAISTLQRLESTYGKPKIKLQCAMRHLAGTDDGVNPCDLMRESFGLLTDGTLLASPWALNIHGKPLDDAWILGDLGNHTLAEILASEKSMEYRGKLDQNFGQCKVFSFLHSSKEKATDRIFDRSDPLYPEDAPAGADKVELLKASSRVQTGAPSEYEPRSHMTKLNHAGPDPQQTAQRVQGNMRERVDAVAFDLDGVVWRSFEPIPHIGEVIKRIRAAGLKVCFLSNYANRDRGFLCDRLADIGIPSEREDMFTSSFLAALHLRSTQSHRRHYVTVEDGSALAEEFRSFGMPVETLASAPASEDSPCAVVVGYSESFGYQDVARLLRISGRVEGLYATARDRWYGARSGPLPASGWIVAAAEEVLARRAVTLGKPNALALQTVANFISVPVGRILMVGDSVESDVTAARNSGAISCLFRDQAAPAMTLPAGARADCEVTDLREIVSLLS